MKASLQAGLQQPQQQTPENGSVPGGMENSVLFGARRRRCREVTRNTHGDRKREAQNATVPHTALRPAQYVYAKRVIWKQPA